MSLTRNARPAPFSSVFPMMLSPFTPSNNRMSAVAGSVEFETFPLIVEEVRTNASMPRALPSNVLFEIVQSVDGVETLSDQTSIPASPLTVKRFASITTLETEPPPENSLV